MNVKNQMKKGPHVFRRWDNKKYAVFNSLKKTVVIGCLVLAYFVHINPQDANAQTDTVSVAREYDLESVDVTSDALPETYSNISRVVVTVSKSEIERAAISSINELLEYATNIDIRQRGVNGMQADVSIRGGSFDQVLILLNGVNITDPHTGHHNLNLPLDFTAVKRIEILKGPGAWKFGPGAFSGAINIITEPSEKTFLSVGIEGGQYKYHTEKVSAGFATKKTKHLLAFRNAGSKGYVANTDYLLQDLFYHGTYSIQKSELSIQAGLADKGFGANSFYTARYPDQYEEIQTYFASAAMKVQMGKLQLNPKIYLRRNNDWFTLFRETPEWYSNYHTSDVFGANLLGSYKSNDNGVTSFGIDHRTETIYSNNLGEITDTPITSPVNDTIALNRFHSRSTISAFVGHKQYFNKLMINAGVNVTINTDLLDKIFVYPGVDMNYSLSESSSVFASVNKTMRMPTYTDLYYMGPNNEGNPNLLPEEAIGYEMGYSYVREGFNFSATGFYLQGSNMIDWVRATVDDKWTTMNYTSLNTIGAELNAKADLSVLLSNQNWLKTMGLAYTTMNQGKMEADLISNYSLNYLKHRMDLDLVHAVWKNISAGWHIAYQDRNGQYEEIIDKEVQDDEGATNIIKASNGMVDYQPFVTSDIKLIWAHNGWNINASVNNLFNVSYYDFGNVPQPGRWIKFGISKKLEF